MPIARYQPASGGGGGGGVAGVRTWAIMMILLLSSSQRGARRAGMPEVGPFAGPSRMRVVAPLRSAAVGAAGCTFNMLW